MRWICSLTDTRTMKTRRRAAIPQGKRIILSVVAWTRKPWLRLHYLFPIGQGRMEKERRIVLRDGLVLQGSRDTWPPLPWRTGYTMMGVRPFYRSQDMNMSFLGDRHFHNNCSDFFLEYDATDFSDNPGRGSRMYVGVTRGLGKWAPQRPPGPRPQRARLLSFRWARAHSLPNVLWHLASGPAIA